MGKRRKKKQRRRGTRRGKKHLRRMTESLEVQAACPALGPRTGSCWFSISLAAVGSQYYRQPVPRSAEVPLERIPTGFTTQLGLSISRANFRLASQDSSAQYLSNEFQAGFKPSSARFTTQLGPVPLERIPGWLHHPARPSRTNSRLASQPSSAPVPLNEFCAVAGL